MLARPTPASSVSAKEPLLFNVTEQRAIVTHRCNRHAEDLQPSDWRYSTHVAIAFGGSFMIPSY
jgi:hypothetical protein